MYRIKANKEIRVNAVSCVIPNFKTEHLFTGVGGYCSAGKVLEQR